MRTVLTAIATLIAISALSAQHLFYQDSLALLPYLEKSAHFRYTHLDSAINYASRGLDRARAVGYRMGEAMTLNAIGQVYEAHDLLEQAEKYISDANQYFRELEFTKGVAATHNGLGVIAGKQANYEKATAHFLVALALNKQINNVPGIVQTYIKLGVVNDHIGNLDKSLEYYLAAKTLNDKEPVSNATLTLLNNIGIIYAKQNDLTNAMRYFQEGVTLSENAKFSIPHIALLSSVGIAYQKMGKLDSALYIQNIALKRSRSYKLPEHECRALINIASVYQDQQKHNEGLTLLKEALTIANRIGHANLTMEIYEGLIGLYKGKQSYKEALAMTDKFYTLRDSLFTIQKAKEVANLQAIYDLKQQSQDLQRLAEENQRSSRQRDIFIIATLITSILVIITLHYKRRASKLNVELLTQQEALKKSNTIKDKLFSILGHDLRSPLNSVIGLVEVLGKMNQNKAERTILEKLKHQTINTVQTLDNILVWGDSQLNGKNTKKESIELKDRFKKTASLLLESASFKNITIEEDIDEKLFASVDPNHLDFIFRNLLTNAIKFSTPGNAVYVRASVQDDYVVVSIADSGKGIKLSRKQEIFQNPQSERGTWNEKGTGIGLKLCQEFVSENGGNIWFQSEEGVGTTFFVSLPSAQPANIVELT